METPLTPEQRTALLALVPGRRLFCGTQQEAPHHRQLVIKGLAACRVEDREYIRLTPLGEQVARL